MAPKDLTTQLIALSLSNLNVEQLNYIQAGT